jgi:Alginate export
LKYIPLPFDDPKSYVSLGLTLRERFELNDAPPGVRRVRRFVLGGTLKARVGRQEMAFDLQRFVSVRDGPNVRQAYDAVWLDWEQREWRVIGFWSQPVQYHHEHPFDDFSSGHLQYGGLRAERQDVGPGELSAYYSRFIRDSARFLDARGDERCHNLDMRYAGARTGFDWDLEAMGQFGDIGGKSIRAWAVGSRSGYTIAALGWTPRLGLQIDAASGGHKAGDEMLGTVNPLFPNGYYFTFAGRRSPPTTARHPDLDAGRGRAAGGAGIRGPHDGYDVARLDVRARHWGGDEHVDLAGDHGGTGATVRAEASSGAERAAREHRPCDRARHGRRPLRGGRAGARLRVQPPVIRRGSRRRVSVASFLENAKASHTRRDMRCRSALLNRST